jgi:hypothetical protein
MTGPFCFCAILTDGSKIRDVDGQVHDQRSNVQNCKEPWSTIFDRKVEETLTETTAIEEHRTLAPPVQLCNQRQQRKSQRSMQNRLDSSRGIKPHEVEGVRIIEGVWRQRSVEQWDVGDLAYKDDAEEEGYRAKDGRLEEAHLVGLMED